MNGVRATVTALLVDLFGVAGDIVPVSFTSGAPTIFGMISFSAFSLQIDISLADLGDDGIANFASIIGNLFEPTDAMEVAGTSPAPGSLAVLGLAGLATTRRRR